MPTLTEVAPKEFADDFYPAFTKHGNVEVVETVRNRPWPGREKNVKVWWVLANGKAVGFNENLVTGWTFPVITYPKG